MSKRVLGAVVGVGIIVAGALALPGAASAKQAKADVCHDGDAGWELINIAEPAVDAHLAHGDALPGDLVPDMAGFEFGDDCRPVEALAKAGCFETAVGGFFVLTDGTNPQLFNGAGVDIYRDSECTDFIYIDGADRNIAWVWEKDQPSALAACQAVGGEAVYQQTEPNLWICYKP